MSSLMDVTELLHAWNRGDAAALERLVPLIFGELKRLARRSLGGRSPSTYRPLRSLITCGWSKLRAWIGAIERTSSQYQLRPCAGFW